MEGHIQPMESRKGSGDVVLMSPMDQASSSWSRDKQPSKVTDNGDYTAVAAVANSSTSDTETDVDGKKQLDISKVVQHSVKVNLDSETDTHRKSLSLKENDLPMIQKKGERLVQNSDGESSEMVHHGGSIIDKPPEATTTSKQDLPGLQSKAVCDRDSPCAETVEAKNSESVREETEIVHVNTKDIEDRSYKNRGMGVPARHSDKNNTTVTVDTPSTVSMDTEVPHSGVGEDTEKTHSKENLHVSNAMASNSEILLSDCEENSEKGKPSDTNALDLTVVHKKQSAETEKDTSRCEVDDASVNTDKSDRTQYTVTRSEDSQSGQDEDVGVESPDASAAPSQTITEDNTQSAADQAPDCNHEDNCSSTSAKEDSSELQCEEAPAEESGSAKHSSGSESVEDTRTDVAAEGTKTDAAVQGTRADFAVEDTKIDIAIEDKKIDVAVKDKKFDVAVEDTQTDVDIVDKKIDVAVEDRQADVDVEDKKIDVAVENRQTDVAFEDTKTDVASEDAKTDVAVEDSSRTSSLRESPETRNMSGRTDSVIVKRSNAHKTAAVPADSGETQVQDKLFTYKSSKPLPNKDTPEQIPDCESLSQAKINVFEKFSQPGEIQSDNNNDKSRDQGLAETQQKVSVGDSNKSSYSKSKPDCSERLESSREETAEQKVEGESGSRDRSRLEVQSEKFLTNKAEVSDKSDSDKGEESNSPEIEEDSDTAEQCEMPKTRATQNLSRKRTKNRVRVKQTYEGSDDEGKMSDDECEDDKNSDKEGAETNKNNREKTRTHSQDEAKKPVDSIELKSGHSEPHGSIVSADNPEHCSQRKQDSTRHATGDALSTGDSRPLQNRQSKALTSASPNNSDDESDSSDEDRLNNEQAKAIRTSRDGHKSGNSDEEERRLEKSGCDDGLSKEPGNLQSAFSRTKTVKMYTRKREAAVANRNSDITAQPHSSQTAKVLKPNTKTSKPALPNPNDLQSDGEEDSDIESGQNISVVSDRKSNSKGSRAGLKTMSGQKADQNANPESKSDKGTNNEGDKTNNRGDKRTNNAEDTKANNRGNTKTKTGGNNAVQTLTDQKTKPSKTGPKSNAETKPEKKLPIRGNSGDRTPGGNSDSQPSQKTDRNPAPSRPSIVSRITKALSSTARKLGSRKATTTSTGPAKGKSSASSLLQTISKTLTRGKKRPSSGADGPVAKKRRSGVAKQNDSEESDDSGGKTADHETGGQHACSLCQREFHTPARLQKHMANHEAGRHFCCDVCGKSFENQEKLDIHHQVHEQSVDGVFTCTQCNKQCKNWRSYTYHVSKHSVDGGKKFSCKACGHSMSTLLRLERHMTHHKKGFHFCCFTCGKLFLDQEGLDKHQAAHASRTISLATSTPVHKPVLSLKALGLLPTSSRSSPALKKSRAKTPEDDQPPPKQSAVPRATRRQVEETPTSRKAKMDSASSDSSESKGVGSCKEESCMAEDTKSTTPIAAKDQHLSLSLSGMSLEGGEVRKSSRKRSHSRKRCSCCPTSPTLSPNKKFMSAENKKLEQEETSPSGGLTKLKHSQGVKQPVKEDHAEECSRMKEMDVIQHEVVLRECRVKLERSPSTSPQKLTPERLLQTSVSNPKEGSQSKSSEPVPKHKPTPPSLDPPSAAETAKPSTTGKGQRSASDKLKRPAFDQFEGRKVKIYRTASEKMLPKNLALSNASRERARKEKKQEKAARAEEAESKKKPSVPEVTHQVDKSLPCTVCSETFPSDSSLKIHFNKHLNNSKRKQNVDIEAVAQSCRLASTRGLPEKSGYLCNRCGYNARTYADLTKHMWLHPPKKHQCVECGAAFSTAGNLEQHMKAHPSSKAKGHRVK